MGENEGWNIRDLIEIRQSVSGGNWGRPRKSSFRCYGVPKEIRNDGLSSKGLGLCPSTRLLGDIFHTSQYSFRDLRLQRPIVFVLLFYDPVGISKYLRWWMLFWKEFGGKCSCHKWGSNPAFSWLHREKPQRNLDHDSHWPAEIRTTFFLSNILAIYIY